MKRLGTVLDFGVDKKGEGLRPQLHHQWASNHPSHHDSHALDSPFDITVILIFAERVRAQQRLACCFIVIRAGNAQRACCPVVGNASVTATRGSVEGFSSVSFRLSVLTALFVNLSSQLFLLTF